MDCNDITNSINIQFKNDILRYAEICLPQKTIDFLSGVNEYSYDDTSNMRDLLSWIISNTDPDLPFEVDDVFLQRKIFGVINNKSIEVNLDFSVDDYVRNNSIDGIILFEYQIGISGGWGEQITSTIKLVMPSSEHGHEKTPHVHVQKGKYRKNDPESNTVRVKLDDNLTVMDNAERKAKKLFGKEWSWILEIIKRNRDKLIENYKLMMKGGNPEYLYLDCENKVSSFNAARFDKMGTEWF